MYFTLKFTRYTETILYIAFFFPIEKKNEIRIKRRHTFEIKNLFIKITILQLIDGLI